MVYAEQFIIYPQNKGICGREIHIHVQIRTDIQSGDPQFVFSHFSATGKIRENSEESTVVKYLYNDESLSSLLTDCPVDVSGETICPLKEEGEGLLFSNAANAILSETETILDALEKLYFLTQPVKKTSCVPCANVL